MPVILLPYKFNSSNLTKALKSGSEPIRRLFCKLSPVIFPLLLHFTKENLQGSFSIFQP